MKEVFLSVIVSAAIAHQSSHIKYMQPLLDYASLD